MSLGIRPYEVNELFTRLLPSQEQFIFAPESMSAVAGGVGCLAPETIVEGIPVAERKQEDVSTFYGHVRPANPILFPRADLYKVRFQSNSEVVVTADHRFLTLIGWQKLSDLREGCAVAGDGIYDGRYASKKDINSPGYCFDHFHQNDGSLRPEELDALDKWQQLRKIVGDDNAWGVLFSFLSKIYSSRHAEPLPIVEEFQSGLIADELLPTASGWMRVLFGNNARSLRMILQQLHEEPLRAWAMNAYELLAEEKSFSPSQFTAFWDEIKEISFARNGQFYDFHVPFAEHYSAQGIWHHNCGKSHAGVLKGLLLSAVIPGNRGMMLCYRGTDLETRLVPLFEQLCPSSWIKSSIKKPFRTYTLRNNSVITFQHLHDAHSSTKTGRLGANLGWFFISQLEECEETHWHAMLGRLRWPGAPKKFAFADLNPAGRDWTWHTFFQGVRKFPKDEFGHAKPIDGKYYQLLRPRPDVLGIAVDSEENRVGNGGFVEGEFFDRMLENFGEAYVDRYVHCSFDDFKGKLFPDYEAGLVDMTTASVHNIEPFRIPRNWECIGGIDVGGDSPWAVVPTYVDEFGNLIVTPGFDRRTGRVIEVANWIKKTMPWNEARTTFVCDWENRVATVELGDNGIHCQTANKDVNAGLLRLEGYLHIRKDRPLPPWYEETQPKEQYARFRTKGSPRMFVFKSALTWRREFDTAKWDPNKPDTMFKSSTARWDQVEATRYVVMQSPGPSRNAPDEKYAKMEKADPLTARTWKEFDQRLAEAADRGKGRGGGRYQACEEEERTEEWEFMDKRGDEF